MNSVSRFNQLLIPDSKQFRIKITFGGKLFQQIISLQKCAVVFQQIFKVTLIVLRNYTIHKFSAFVTASQNQINIRRCNHYQWQQPDMFTSFL